MSETATNEPASQKSGALADLTQRLKRGERDTILALAACGIALLQFMIGATGGALLTAAMLLNLALIGWLGNTAVARWRAGEGAGLLVVTGVAMALATLSTLYLAEGLSTIVNTAAAFESLDF